MSVCENESQFRKIGDGDRERERERGGREREREREEREEKRAEEKKEAEECINTDDTPTERTSAGLEIRSETTVHCR